MRKFNYKVNEGVRIESNINLPKLYVEEIKKASKESLSIDSIESIGGKIEKARGKQSLPLETLLEKAFTSESYEKEVQNRLGFFNHKKPSLTGTMYRNEKEKVYNKPSLSTHASTLKIMKSLRLGILKNTFKIGTISKPIVSTPSLPEQVKVYPVKPSKYMEESEKAFNPYTNLFWSKKWEVKKASKKKESYPLEIFSSKEEYNKSSMRLGKPME